jgi:hypothetical protein
MHALFFWLVAPGITILLLSEGLGMRAKKDMPLGDCLKPGATGTSMIWRWLMQRHTGESRYPAA